MSVLRTSLVKETIAGKAIYELLREDEDMVVKITAAALVSNLVLEFSPMKDVLIGQGCMERICALAHSRELLLKVNALWALKNGAFAPFAREAVRLISYLQRATTAGRSSSAQ